MHCLYGSPEREKELIPPAPLVTVQNKSKARKTQCLRAFFFIKIYNLHYLQTLNTPFLKNGFFYLYNTFLIPLNFKDKFELHKCYKQNQHI